MSETPELTVPTAFADISQLAEGMSDRVDEERLMLYGPGPVDDNSWIRFSVLLMDQSVALAGVGRAVASIDGGEERPEVARFDIVLDNLQFEGTSEVVYERMLVYRSQAFTDGPGTGEVSVEEVDAAEAALAAEPEGEVATASADDEYLAEDPTMVASAEEYAEHVEATAAVDDVADADLADVEAEFGEEVEAEALEVAPDDYEDAAPTAVVADEVEEVAYQDDGAYDAQSTESETFAEVHTDDLEGPSEDWQTNEVDVGDIDEVHVADVTVPPSAPPPAPPERPAGFTLEASNGALTRPSRGATWEPNLALAPEPRTPSGLFPYAGGLPIPDRAPRPDLDPSYRIQPAPRPVEAGAGDSTDTAGYEEPTAAYQEAGEHEAAEGDHEAVPESGYEEAPAELEPVESAGLDYEEDYASEDAESFDDLATEVVADDEAVSYDEAPVEGYEDAETRMDLEAPDEQ